MTGVWSEKHRLLDQNFHLHIVPCTMVVNWVYCRNKWSWPFYDHLSRWYRSAFNQIKKIGNEATQERNFANIKLIFKIRCFLYFIFFKVFLLNF